jgi:hypothetical protein
MSFLAIGLIEINCALASYREVNFLAAHERLSVLRKGR